MRDERDVLIGLLGDFPGKCPLKPKILSRKDKGSYIIEKLEFQSDREERVPAYLLIPKKRKKKSPALVNIHEHGGSYAHGKSKVIGMWNFPDQMGAQAVEACLKGFVVIAPDLKCFGERRPPVEERRKKMGYSDGWYERFVAQNLLLKGTTLQARYVFDLSRTVDYLCTRKEVDTERIGAFGHSLGGQETVYLMMYDKRVKAGVCDCGVGSIETIIRDGIIHNFAMYLPGILKHMDMDGVIGTIFPRPMLLINADNDDIFPIDGVRKIYSSVLKKYKKAGLEDRFKLIVHSKEHGFFKEEREKAFAWLKKWV